MEDAILNICINAMPNGGTLDISTHKTRLQNNCGRTMYAEPGGYVVVVLSDTGTGMDTETLEKIFDPFFSTKGEKGTGLGLSQVYGFMQQSNGAVHVDSEQGQGTRFTLYFPRLLDADKAVSSDETKHAAELPTGRGSILVVDDEVALQNLP